MKHYYRLFPKKWELNASLLRPPPVVQGKRQFEDDEVLLKIPAFPRSFPFVDYTSISKLWIKKIPLRHTPLWLELEYHKIQSIIAHRLAILQYLFSDFYIIRLAASTSQPLGGWVIQPDMRPFDLLYRYPPYRTTPGPNLPHH